MKSIFITELHIIAAIFFLLFSLTLDDWGLFESDVMVIGEILNLIKIIDFLIFKF